MSNLDYEIYDKFLDAWEWSNNKLLQIEDFLLTISNDNYPSKKIDNLFEDSGYLLSGYTDSGKVDVYVLMELAKNLIEYAIKNKEIPADKKRELASAYRAVNRQRRMSSEVMWLYKNIEKFSFLIEMPDWVDIVEHEIDIGGVSIINHTDNDVNNIINVVKGVTKIIRDSGIVNTEKLINNTRIVVIDHMHRDSNVNAEYSPNEDLIQVYYTAHFKKDDVLILIHEWGHKLWRKYIPKPLKELWIEHHKNLLSGVTNPKIPKIGDELTLLPGVPTVIDIRGDKIYTSDQKAYRKGDYIRYIKNEIYIDTFPTLYSSKSAEEHFCEAFSLYCANMLSSPHREIFEDLFTNTISENMVSNNLYNKLWQ